jgi:hypothetical protein
MPSMAALGESNDESGFFSVLPPPPALAGGLTLLTECLAIARRLPGSLGAEIAELLVAVREAVDLAAVETARVGSEAARRHLDVTRVRPEAGGFRGGRKRLNEGIHSEALGGGAVGIGSIEGLDSVVGTDGKPYWRAQEYGYQGNVGRVVLGFFQPGSHPASQEQFRQHGVFVAGAGPPMHIQRPIPARHFMREGAAAAMLFREARFREIELASVADLRGMQIQATALGAL